LEVSRRRPRQWGNVCDGRRLETFTSADITYGCAAARFPFVGDIGGSGSFGDGGLWATVMPAVGLTRGLPVTNRLRLRGGPQKGVSDPRQLVRDYTNPILKPQVAEFVKKHGEMELSGVGSSTPISLLTYGIITARDAPATSGQGLPEWVTHVLPCKDESSRIQTQQRTKSVQGLVRRLKCSSGG
jgi:hypothetical protein